LAEYQNPQNEPGTERRLMVALVLMFGAILLFQPLIKKYLPTPAAPPTQAQNQAPAQAEVPPPAGAMTAAPATGKGAAAVPTKQATAEAETVIENDVYRITFTNRGAQVKSWILKKYTDDQDKPLDLLNNAAAAKYGYPLSLWTYDEALRNKINAAMYVASSTGPVTVPGSVTFEYADADVNVRKTFTFDDSYVVKLETSVTQRGALVSALPMWPAGFGDEITSANYNGSRVEYHNDESTERSMLFMPKLTQRLDIKSVVGGATLPGPFNWAGVVDQYFAAVFLPENPASSSLVTLHYPLDIPKDPTNPKSQDRVKVNVLGVAVGNLHGPTVQRIFVGPKSLHILETVPIASNVGKRDLSDLINFGFFGVIARPLFLWLKWTYEHIVPNWGWAIVIQTFIITVALLPLRISSMKSALRMQKLQPQMNAVKEKYKKYSMRDPRKQEMNQEIAALMKKEGVNPAGGCLPMVVQLPFLYAYYAMLGSALDLRHAHWLWITDLSSRDPYFILTIGIVITMLFAQRMTPQAGMDPAQQKMMAIMMPMMMGVISYNLAAGLCLYWAESQLIGVVQQIMMNRSSLGQEMRDLAAKRARKKGK